MSKLVSWRAARGAAIGAAALAVATLSLAVRPQNTGSPVLDSAASVPQQSASVQSDESASLRQGTVTALDERGARLQVQGIWLAVVADKTHLVRAGRASRLETLQLGEAIRFTVMSAESGAPSLGVIYAP
ncbi:MAG: hypothetical protein ABI364_06265 [Caldimonas sp.]